MKKNILLAPGPTPAPSSTLLAMALADAGHTNIPGAGVAKAMQILRRAN